MTLIEKPRLDPRMMSRRWESAGGQWGVTPVVKRLLIVTVAIYLLQVAITQTVTVRVIDQNTMASTVGSIKISAVQRVLELSLPEVRAGEAWRMVTYAFCHARSDISHLAFNMIGLFMFGRAIERRYGGREFFLF